MKRPREYLVDQILKTREVHIIGGSSGSGKTTWALQTLDQWRQGAPVFDLPSHPRPFCYVSCDRSEESIELTLERVGIDPSNIPYLDCRDKIGKDTPFEDIVSAARARVPGLHLLFIEGFANLAPRVRNLDINASVARFLINMGTFVSREDMTVIGTMHSPKMRDGAGYADPRQRLSGPNAWSGFSDTNIIIECVKPDDPSDRRRRLYLIPRNSAGQVIDYELDDRGRFVEPCISIASDDKLERFLESLETGTEFQRLLMVSYGRRNGVSERTVNRWLKQAVDDGVIDKTGYATYRVVPRKRTIH